MPVQNDDLICICLHTITPNCVVVTPCNCTIHTRCHITQLLEKKQVCSHCNQPFKKISLDLFSCAILLHNPVLQMLSYIVYMIPFIAYMHFASSNNIYNIFLWQLIRYPIQSLKFKQQYWTHACCYIIPYCIGYLLEHDYLYGIYIITQFLLYYMLLLGDLMMRCVCYFLIYQGIYVLSNNIDGVVKNMKQHITIKIPFF